MSEFITTKEECESRIRGVCTQCGRKLSAIKTVDNLDRPTYWAGCNYCQRFDSGTSREIFEKARNLLLRYRISPPYSSIEKGEEDTQEREYWIRTQTGAIVSIIHTIFVEFGIPIFTTTLSQGDTVEEEE